MLKLIEFLALIALNSSYPAADQLPRQQLMCLATAVYHEARGEPTEGQSAVAHVVLNRVKSNRYPNTICEVVYQSNQFSYISLASPDYSSEAWSLAVEEAVFAYIGFTEDPTHGALFYYAHAKVDPYWAKQMRVTQVISNHTYLR